jgi:hypothetical protein
MKATLSERRLYDIGREAEVRLAAYLKRMEDLDTGPAVREYLSGAHEQQQQQQQQQQPGTLEPLTPGSQAPPTANQSPASLSVAARTRPPERQWQAARATAPAMASVIAQTPGKALPSAGGGSSRSSAGRRGPSGSGSSGRDGRQAGGSRSSSAAAGRAAAAAARVAGDKLAGASSDESSTVGAVAAAEAAAAQAAQAAQLAMAAAVAAAAAATQAAVDFGAPWATSRTPAKPTAFDDAAFAQAAAASAAASEAQQAAARAEKAQEGIEDLRLSIRLAEEEREREALWEGATPNRFHTRGCPDDEDGAATAMQRRWRGERARRLVQELREYLALTAQLARWRRREAAALVIQSWTRGMHARIEYRRR